MPRKLGVWRGRLCNLTGVAPMGGGNRYVKEVDLLHHDPRWEVPCTGLGGEGLEW